MSETVCIKCIKALDELDQSICDDCMDISEDKQLEDIKEKWGWS